MFLSRAYGFAKEAAPGDPLYKSIARGAWSGVKALARRPGARTFTVGVGLGLAGGAYVNSQLQKQPPMEAGALQREKRRVEIDRFGSL